MAYVNEASSTKQTRAGAINTAIGTSGNLLIYSGSAPASPDIAASGTLLATLALSSTAAVASLAFASGAITAAGSSGTNGTFAVVFSGGGGSGAAANFTVSGGALTAITWTAGGSGYTSAPTMAFTNSSGLSGATATSVMTGVLVFNSITQANAVATNTAGWARLATSGGTGIVDMDVATSGASLNLNTTSIVSGGPVQVTSLVLTEA